MVLTRIILDYIPFFFGVNTFDEVIAKYSNNGTNSFKKLIDSFQKSTKSIKDIKFELLPQKLKHIDYSQELDFLLSEVLGHLS